VRDSSSSQLVGVSLLSFRGSAIRLEIDICSMLFPLVDSTIRLSVLKREAETEESEA
jgi:hypothetical protein